ncbi:MAG: glucokinase [Myxococcaceae bacterium]|nr:glucokinase [Myxococcaceae bacterium]
MLLVGDIGGTNTRIAVLPPKGGAAVHEARVPSQTFPTFGHALKAALAGTKFKLTGACFGIAGPVIGNRCVATNLPWVIDGNALAKALKVKKVRLVNDLVAIAVGAVNTPKKQLVPLNGDLMPQPKGQNVAIIAAGTGLGEAALIWDGETGRHVALGTEGSHGDYAPREPIEEELREFLSARHGRVSTERVVSGPGLKALYEFFRDVKKLPENEAPNTGADVDFSAEVTRLALSDANPCARAAVDLFTRAYGAEAGNMVLRYLATGGIYVAGNIANVLEARLKSPMFRDAFVTKGRFSPLLEKTAVALVDAAGVGLKGAAAIAMQR